MTDNMEIAMAAINKWVYFSLNYKVVPYTNPNNNEVIYTPEFITVIMDVPYQSHDRKMEISYTF